MKKMLLMLMGAVFCVQAVFAGQVVVATSDYETGNTAVYNSVTGGFAPNVLGHADHDVAVVTDGEFVYFLSKGQGALSKYDPESLDTAHMIYEFSVDPGSNPNDVVFLDTKAYVIRYGSPEILIVDHNASDESSFRLGTIDVSAYDENGFPEMIHGFAHDGMVYVVLQRLNGWSADIPGYLLKIDPETDSLVDLDPGTDGVQGIELLVRNPQYFSQNGAVAYIGGHVWGEQAEGVQTVDLADPALSQAMLLDEEALGMDITGVTVFGENAGVFNSSGWIQDDEGNWIQVGAAYWFNPVTGDIGETLPVPTPDGGAVMVGGTAYIASRDDVSPGIYPVDPATNTLAGDPMLATLPPISMVFVGGDDPVFVAGDGEKVPGQFMLRAPYPNPFNPSTTISFSLNIPGRTVVDIFNVSGQKVATLLDSYMNSGTHTVVWNAADISAGIYFITVRHAGQARSAKVVFVK